MMYKQRNQLGHEGDSPTVLPVRFFRLFEHIHTDTISHHRPTLWLCGLCIEIVGAFPATKPALPYGDAPSRLPTLCCPEAPSVSGAFRVSDDHCSPLSVLLLPPFCTSGDLLCTVHFRMIYHAFTQDSTELFATCSVSCTGSLLCPFTENKNTHSHTQWAGEGISPFIEAAL